jgi:hypothetical protein
MGMVRNNYGRDLLKPTVVIIKGAEIHADILQDQFKLISSSLGKWDSSTSALETIEIASRIKKV